MVVPTAYGPPGVFTKNIAAPLVNEKTPCL